jgi:uncharacterized membrane protein
MQDIVTTLQAWQFHPVANHFTIALLTVAIVTDLIASLFPTRIWLRYMALTLTVVGAGSAALSYVSGGWEAQRMEESLKTLTSPAVEIFKFHAQLGQILGYAFTALAFWRILIQVTDYVARFRPLYLLVAIGALAALLFQGLRGGEMVFLYGIGTRVMAASPIATPQAAASASAPTSPTSRPTVFNPPPTPGATSTPTATPETSPSASPSPTASESPV